MAPCPRPLAGGIHDCDFHYALEVPPEGATSVFDLKESFAEKAGEAVQLRRHCWGCTAGAGSS